LESEKNKLNLLTNLPVEIECHEFFEEQVLCGELTVDDGLKPGRLADHGPVARLDRLTPAMADK